MSGKRNGEGKQEAKFRETLKKKGPVNRKICRYGE